MIAEPAAMARTLFDDPINFGKAILSHKYWSKQKQLMRAVQSSRRVAVKGCNGSGKAFAAADLACWWLLKYPDGIVIVTSPSETQLQNVMWSYIHRNVGMWNTAGWTVNLLSIRVSESNYMLGFTTNSDQSFSGWHGQVLIIVDEAPGVKQFIFDAIDGIMAAGDVHLLLLGNPVIAGGTFYRAFADHAANWHTISIDAFETPNLRGLEPSDLLRMSEDELDATAWPQLTRRRWVRDMLVHGESSPVWQSRVRGQFPTQSATALYPLVWLEQAQRRAADPGGPCVAGIDVAGPGDDETALTVRCDGVVLYQGAWQQPEPQGYVLDALRPFQQRLQAVHVDEIGIGYYFVSALRNEGYNAIGVNVTTPSIDPSRWANYKAEIYWTLREQLEQGRVKNLLDRECFGQAAAVQYKPNNHGQIQIESKDDLRKRGVSSPDRLESLILAFVTPRDAQPPRPRVIGVQRNVSLRRGM